MSKPVFLLCIIPLWAGMLSGTCSPSYGVPKDKTKGNKMSYEVQKSEEEWKKVLTSDQFRILREKGTERAFTGEYYYNKEKGKYLCAACGAELFNSDTKYESGSGWPSFYKPATEKGVASETDTSHGMTRVEVHCARCGGHLGHVFPDGPAPTGLRYCINSASLKFKKD
ncbi:methionine-R-sulfoxide reductase [Leptospira inadai serovar Lyme str. 10]|uniref:Peptide methionine sulfoxide reductase MsrB n=3 Tax=Leptospira inadai TaxID=29506 RepID=V6HF61_9LEPT|nr:methionine-R-sulfoxide reductase [Leptospira inadai serovar Lyme str. 10]PNV75061.1 peptide-methionine (R)-S-oxide reductase [Leptospira inadai serovar Lyme]